MEIGMYVADLQAWEEGKSIDRELLRQMESLEDLIRNDSKDLALFEVEGIITNIREKIK